MREQMLNTIPNVSPTMYTEKGFPLNNSSAVCFFNAGLQFLRNINGYFLEKFEENPLNERRRILVVRLLKAIKGNVPYNKFVDNFIEGERKLKNNDRIFIQHQPGRNEDTTEQLNKLIEYIPEFKMLAGVSNFRYEGEFKNKTCNVISVKKPDPLTTFLFIDTLRDNHRHTIQQLVNFKYNKFEIRDPQNNIKGGPEHQCVWEGVDAYGYYLIVQIKLFYMDAQMNLHKVPHTEYPIVKQTLKLPTGSGVKNYELISAIYHSGEDFDHGHYYTYGYNTDNTVKPKWYVYNDTIVKPAKPVDDKTSSAYVLLYKLRDVAPTNASVKPKQPKSISKKSSPIRKANASRKK